MKIQTQIIALPPMLLAPLLLIGVACSNDQSRSAAVASVPGNTVGAGTAAIGIAFHSVNEPHSGKNAFEAMVRTSNGSPVDDANVSAVLRMPPMPSMNMPEMHTTVELAAKGNGRYSGEAELSMSGTWNVTVTVARAGSESVSQNFTLIAK